MENTDRPKYFAIRMDRRVKVKTQEQAGRAKGYDPDFFVRLDKDGVEALIGPAGPDGAPPLLRRGYQLGIYRYDLIAPLRSEKYDRTPRKVLKEATDRLLEIGVFLEEIDSGRTCKDENGVYLIYADAVDRLAGNTGTSRKRGRPKKARSDEDIAAAKAIWESNKYVSNKEAVEAMPGGDWNLAEANERFGGSGRQGGRRKKK
jgi:hypothetical protein